MFNKEILKGMVTCVDTRKMLKTNIQTIQATIDEHLPINGKEPTVVAVTKTVDVELMRQLHQLGVTNFGENRPDVFLTKYETLNDIQKDLTWHFIGNLQTRQVKKIINEIDYLHSLDRLSLAKEIQKRAEHPIQCFLQINVSGEASKSGFEPEQIDEIIDELAAYDKINIVGLMTMAPIDATEDELKTYFSSLKQLQGEVEAKEYSHAPCTEVSMGMSQDYPIAVNEGASFVRIGSAFFKDIL